MNRPRILQLNPETIPVELTAINAWVGFRLVSVADGWKKAPINLRTGKFAETDNADTWVPFGYALTNYRQWSCDGIGICRVEDFIFTDLDGVLDENGQIRPFEWAQNTVRAVSRGSYIEISATGTGIHAITRGKLPPGRRELKESGFDDTGVAFYDSARFFTVSGLVLPQSNIICDLTRELAKLHRELFPPNGNTTTDPRTTQGNDLSDAEIIERALAARNGVVFARLWNGHWQGRYESQSEADLALCRHLAFWTGCDARRIDTLIRQSGLYRDKWQREDYRRRTIAAAIETTFEIYEPHRARKVREQRALPEGRCSNAQAEPSEQDQGTPASGGKNGRGST